MMHKSSIVFLTSILFLLFLAGLIVVRIMGQEVKMQEPMKKDSSRPTKAEAGVVAVINGEKITWDELNIRINQQMSMGSKTALDETRRKAVARPMLDTLIQNRLILQEAARQGIRVTEEEMQKHINTALGQFPSKQAFEDLLKTRKTNFQIWTEDTRDFLTMQRLKDKLMNQIEITDREIEDYWNQYGETLIEDKVKVRDIFLKTDEEVKKILNGLKQGESFEELARKYSQDTATKDKGGDLGWVLKTSLSKELQDPVSVLQPGQVSPLIKTQAGYFLIKLEAREISKRRSLADYREQIKQMIRQNKWYGSLEKDWLDALKAKADIWVDPAAF